jgi:virginiamycin B lyase
MRHLYWTNGYWIGRASLNGTDVNQRFITKVAYGTGIVAIRSGHLYWANLGGLGGAEKGRGTIGRARLDGTDVNQKFIAVPNGPSGVSGLAVNSRYIYWTDETAGTIGRASLNGTGVRQRFITGASFPEAGLTVDSQYLYWANDDSGTIGRARLNGTDVDQRFIITKPSKSLLGLFGLTVDTGH